MDNLSKKKFNMYKKNFFGLNKNLNLKCFKPKYFNYKVVTNCKIYKKIYKYDFCKTSKNYNLDNYSKT